MTTIKKNLFLLSLIFVSTIVQAQNNRYPQNEVKLNIANTIAIASVEFGYERFISEDQSIEGVILLNDRINYHSESGSREFNTNSFKIGYNYYFGADMPGSGLYANPFIKIRTGDFKQDVAINNNLVREETDMDSFIVGLGGGYKWNFNNKFVLGPFVNIARNFSDEVKDRFSAIEFNAGFQVGYRF